MKRIKKNYDQSRRKFLKTSGLAAAGITIVPRYVLGGKGYIAPSDKLNIAVIGAGGRGSSHVKAAAVTENLVAMCDVDDRQAKASYEANPNAKRFKDFRKLYDAVGKEIDAVMVATPDHTHATVALPAIVMGKHVYIEKPLTHNVMEARMLTEAAKKYKVVTQMGNQGASGEGVRQTMEWINSGIIGEVTKVEAWTNRPVWPQGVPTPTEKQPVPAELDWDLWLGPAKHRDYHSTYLPFNWRGWWDFGTGAMGDMACHILDPVFKALKLGHPVKIEASMSQVWSGFFAQADYADSCPVASIVHLEFPERDGMPGVDLTWYDGGLTPRRPAELKPEEPFGNWDGGALFLGTKGKLLCDCYGANPRLLPTAMMNIVKVEPALPRVDGGSGGHMQDWFKACKTGGTTSSSFEYAGPFTESILLGCLALRAYNHKVLKPGKSASDTDAYEIPGRTTLLWDSKAMKVTNVEAMNAFVTREYRKGWELKMV